MFRWVFGTPSTAPLPSTGKDKRNRIQDVERKYTIVALDPWKDVA